jgi:8-oxo-dGTP pyrophosphatase MutT (NUDIX family)
MHMDATSKYTDYFTWLADGGWIRISVRALIFSPAKDQIMVERNLGLQNEYANFIGGGVETGETLQQCIEREIVEETNAKVTRAKYLFVVENFYPYNGERRHSLEHYFEIELDRDDVRSRNIGNTYERIPIEALSGLDLRPTIVRDSIISGSYSHVRHLIIEDDKAES